MPVAADEQATVRSERQADEVVVARIRRDERPSRGRRIGLGAGDSTKELDVGRPQGRRESVATRAQTAPGLQ